MLYESIMKLAERDTVLVNENWQPQLLAEATKTKDDSCSHIITRKLKDVAKDLKEHESIFVRNADKASCFVVMSWEEYKHKLDEILTDTSKLSVETSNPTAQLKTQVNKLIKSTNQQNKSTLKRTKMLTLRDQ